MDTTTHKPLPELATEIVRDFAKLGAAWLRHGLTVSESALKTSARSLESTARALAEVADRLHG
jgi:hypothetical protein